MAGLSERECRRRGIDYEVARYPFAEHGRALTMNVPEGFVKMLAGRDGRILGIAFVGGEAGDLLDAATTLLYFGASVHDLGQIPHLHPTLAEIVTYPAEELAGRIETAGHVP